MRILFYSQHLLGVGHLSSALKICERLLPFAEVTLLQGGDECSAPFSYPEELHVLRLAPLSMDACTSRLYSPKGDHLESAFAHRRQAIEEVTQKPFDALIVEFFPFGRRSLKEEILNLIAQAKRCNPNIKVFCSLRDILVTKANSVQRSKEVSRIVLDHFDHVLVHSDSRVVKLEETFPSFADIEEKVIYTGYLSPRWPVSDRKNGHRVVVSQGGSHVGESLIERVLELESFQHDFDIHYFLSRSTIVRLGVCEHPNVHEFSSQFQHFLSSASLSIGLGGYNTLVEALSCGVFSLIHPYSQNSEQPFRAEIFSQLGWGYSLKDVDLIPKNFIALIDQFMGRDVSIGEFNFNGAEHSAQVIAGMIDA